jgi:antitoxin ParD1/3/4
MRVSLSPELESFVQNKVDSDLYTSANEAICESLHLMHTYDELQAKRINQLNAIYWFNSA